MTDLIIIGSGPGGYRAAEHAAKHGLQVTIIERAEAGGTCLNCGCIPTKALCRTAEVLETIREADVFGIETSTPTLNFTKAMERKDEVVSQLRAGVEGLMQMPGITMLRGEASFVDNHTVKVKSNENSECSEISAKNIIIATGSKPKRLPIPGIDLPGVLDSTAILNLKEKPKSLVIIGAGVIGMEMAAVMNSFGVNVTVVEFLKECLPTLDSDIAKRLRQCLSKKGIEFIMQAACKEIRQGLEVVYERKGKVDSVIAEKVLVATGRAPQIDGLNLEAAYVEVGRNGIIVDDEFCTTAGNIYAIGDVNGKCMLAHAATMQGIDVVNQIINPSENAEKNSANAESSNLSMDGSPIHHNIMPSAIFTRPEAASVGLTEDQAKEMLHTKPLVKKAMYRSNGKALAMNETEGLLKLICNTDGLILGCHIYGAHAADMAQEICVLMNKEAYLKDLATIIHIHPTLGEMVWDAAL